MDEREGGREERSSDHGVSLGALEAQKEMYEKKLAQLQTQLQAPSSSPIPSTKHRVEPR